MLVSGRSRQTTLPNPGSTDNSSSRGSNSAFKFAQATANLTRGSKLTEDGNETLTSRDQAIIQELDEFMTEGPLQRIQTGLANNNNNTAVWTDKMAAANTNGPNQQLANTNGFQLPMRSGPTLPSKPVVSGMNLTSSMLVMDQGGRSSIAPANPSSSGLKLLPGSQNNPGLPRTNQYSQYSQRQEQIMRGFQAGSRASPHEMSNAIMRAEQYGSPQARQPYASSETQLRGLGRQTSSPYSQNYFPQDSHNTQSANRTANTPSDERGGSSSEHFPWAQSRFQSTSLGQVSNAPSIPSSISRTQIQQQPSMLSRRPPYMPMGQAQYPVPPQQQGQQPNPYMMGSSMKPMQQPQQYYNSMAMQGMMGPNTPMGMASRQTAMGNPMQKPQPDFGTYQQQQQSYQHRYPQPNYPPQLPPYMPPRQPPQSMSQSPTGMPRMPMPQHQPILPKPPVDIFGSASSASRYPNSMQDSSMGRDFTGPIMGDQQPPPPPGPPQLHRQQSYSSPGSVVPPSDIPGRQPISQGQYQRGYTPYPSPLQSGSSSPNVTLGSPLRSMPEGFPGPSALSGPAPSYPNPPSNPPSNYGVESPSSHSGAAAAAAAALAAASSMSQFPGMGQQPIDQGGPASYGGSQDGMVGSRGSMGVVPSPRSGTPNLPTPSPAAMNSVETGHVPSPSLNLLPTAEDVETMINILRTNDGCLDDDETSPQSSAPTPASSTSKQAPPPLITTTTKAQRSKDMNSVNESQSITTESPAQGIVPTSTTTDSPMSPFSELSAQADIGDLSSPSSSFGNDQDEMDVPVDAITPTLTQAIPSPYPEQPKPALQYAKFSNLYELDDNPERRMFLDKYSAFMENSGTPVTQVPVIGNQPLDLFKFYKAVRENGGLQEVVKRKAWEQVMSALEIPLHQANLVYMLRTQYARFLLSYEMKDNTHRDSLDDILNNDLEDSGIPPPNAMVTCTEAIIPSATVTISRAGEASTAGPSYNYMNGPQGYNNQGYRMGDRGPEGFESNNKGYVNEAMEPRQQMPQLQNMANYSMQPQYMMGNDRGKYPNYPNRSYPNQSQQFTSTAVLSQLAYQRNQQATQGYPPQAAMPRRPSMGPQQAQHPIMSSQSPQEQAPPMWPGSQYNASSEPGQMFDYLPSGQSARSMRPSMPQHQYPPTPPYNSLQSRQQQQYPPVPPQYRSTSSPHSQPSTPSAMQRPPLTPSQQQQQPTQQMSPKPRHTPTQHHSGHHLKREITFPPDTIECTKPVFTKKRKLTSRDLGPVEAWRVMMSLKSGLLAETTWALDTLNILLYDENTVGYFVLSHLPGLLDNLLDHFRRYLIKIFGSFLDGEIEIGTAFLHKEKSTPRKVDEEKSAEEQLEDDVCRSITAFIASSSIERPEEGFVSRSRTWARGGSDITTHIQTHIGTATSSGSDVKVTTSGSDFSTAARGGSNVSITTNSGSDVNVTTRGGSDVSFSSGSEVSMTTSSRGDATTHINTATSQRQQQGVVKSIGSDSGKCEGKCEVKREETTECTLNQIQSKQTKLDDEEISYLKNAVKKEGNFRSCDLKCVDNRKESVKLENCVANSVSKEWDLDSDSDSDSSSELGRECDESSEPQHKNDSCLSEQEKFTTRLKKELDLLVDAATDDEETDAYIQSVIDSKVQQDKDSSIEEQESIRKEDAPLCLRTESDDAISRRCICISNILRGLSFVPGNDVEMYRHAGLLLILGRLLLLCHEHAKRVPYKRTYLQEEEEHDSPIDDRDDWWWHCLEVVRENALVIISNIAGHLDLTFYSHAIRDPILDGLLHWFVCESADAIDPMPTATVGTSLSAQQMVLEALAKMSILGGNAELILSTPPSSRLNKLYATLVRLLGSRTNPVTRELTLVLLSNLSQTDGELVCLNDKKQCIAMLLQFIEDAANSINAYSSGGALAQAGFHSEDFCGTSVDMLRRAATTLVCLARFKPDRALFLPFQERLLVLATLRPLDGMIGSHLADVLYYLSR